jgi:HEAT repeat protein
LNNAMNRKKSTILIFSLSVLVAGFPGLAAMVSPGGALASLLQGGLFAAEKSPAREISALVNSILDETDDAKKQELVKKLRAYPPAEVGDCWLEKLNDAVRASTTVRIIDNMSEYSDRRFVIPLANLLVSSHYAVRKSAARALKKIGDDRLFPVILKMVNSPTPVHKIYFIEAMNYLFDQRFYPSLTGLLREENKSIRIYVLNCLKENRITESLGLIRGAAMSDKNDEVRIAAIEAIGVMHDGNGLNVLHVTMNDKNRDVRCESVKSISLINSAASVNPLSLRLLVEDDNEIKDLMIDALSSMKRVGDVRGLEKIVSSDSNLGLRIKSAYVLGLSGSQQAFSALQLALKDTDFRVRAEACNSIGNFRTRQALASLFEILEKNDQVYVKSAALYSIRRINEKSSLMGLFDLYTKEKDPIFREMLQDAIRDYIKRYI